MPQLCWMCVFPRYPSKTTVLNVVIAHTAAGFRQHFHLWIIKNMDLETVSHLGTAIIEQNIQKVAKMTPKRLAKWNLKPIQMDTWTSRCLVGVPLEFWITKMVTHGTQDGA